MASNRGVQIFEGFRELLPAGDPWKGSNVVLIVQRYQEYRQNRLSVPLEWRKPLDDFDEFMRGTLNYDYSSMFTELLGDPVIKPKDDEAFRLFRESDIDF